MRDEQLPQPIRGTVTFRADAGCASVSESSCKGSATNEIPSLDPSESEPYSPILVERATRGEADAQFSLGVCYANGAGVEKDEHEAVGAGILRLLSKAMRARNTTSVFATIMALAPGRTS